MEKGIKFESTGWNFTHSMAGIANGKDAVTAQKYDDRINAEKFSSFDHENFVTVFLKKC